MRRRVGAGTTVVGAALALVALVAVPSASARGGAVRPAASSGDLTTYAYGTSRSNHDTVDPTIHHVSANPSWDDSLDGSVYGQPLVLDGVVYVATENDTVYAIAAKTGVEQWHVHVGNPAPLSVVDTAPTLGGGCGGIDPLGITGTPVIDASTHRLYAVAETLSGGRSWQDVRHWLVAVSLTTHRELWHRDVDPPDANQAAHYYIAAEQERSALTLVHDRIYVTYGGLNGDCGTYHGYVTSAPASGPTGGLLSYQVPTQREGGIWGGGGTMVSSAGDLYVATGNGSSSSLSHFDEGNSMVELSPTLRRLGYWAPSNWVQLNNADWDLGSASAIAVPGQSMLFIVGKPSDRGTIGYLMRDKLGGIGHGAASGLACGSGGVFGADASDVIAGKTYIYTACQDGTEAVELHTSSPIGFHEVWSASGASPNGVPMVGGGYVWALDWNNNDLDGMNPLTGHVVFQRPTDGLNHFAAVSLGDGELVVPTGGGVEAYAVS